MPEINNKQKEKKKIQNVAREMFGQNLVFVDVKRSELNDNVAVCLTNNYCSNKLNLNRVLTKC